MPPELLAVVSTLLGAMVAGFISFIAGRGLKTHEWRLAMAREGVAVRQRLYAEFLNEAQALYLQSLDEKISRVGDVKGLTRSFEEICLLSNDSTVNTARLICDVVFDAHSVEPIEKLSFYDAKQAFIKEARAELADFQKQRRRCT